MERFAIVLACFATISHQKPIVDNYGTLGTMNADYLARMEFVRESCLSETLVNPTSVNRLLTAGEFAEDRSLKCFQKCVFVKMNAMTEGGEMEAELQQSQLPVSSQVAMDDRIERCKLARGLDACETAFLVTKCLFELEEAT